MICAFVSFLCILQPFQYLVLTIIYYSSKPEDLSSESNSLEIKMIDLSNHFDVWIRFSELFYAIVILHILWFKSNALLTIIQVLQDPTLVFRTNFKRKSKVRKSNKNIEGFIKHFKASPSSSVAKLEKMCISFYRKHILQQS